MKHIKPRTYKNRIGQSRFLRAKKKESAYKSINTYLEAVWKSNRKVLEGKLFKPPAETRSDREIFKSKVKEFMKETNPETGKPYTLKQAIDRVQRSELITPEERRLSEVSFTRFSYSEQEYINKKGEKKKRMVTNENYTKLRKAIGWKNKLDINNVVDSWSEGKKNYFRYYDKATGKDIIVIEEISPKSGETHVDFIDYGDWRESVLSGKNDPASYSELIVQRTINEARKKEIDRVRELNQGEKYIPYIPFSKRNRR